MRTGQRISDTGSRRTPPPFSAEWIDDPPAPERPRRLPLREGWLPATLPAWLPSERVITTALVLILVLTTTAFASAGGGQRDATTLPGPTADTAMVVTQPPGELAVVASDGGEAAAGTDGDVSAAQASPEGSSEAVAGGAADETGTQADDPDAETPAASEAEGATDDAGATGGTGLSGDQEPVTPLAHDDDGSGLLPDNRIVAVYGFPTDVNMGILGEYGIDDIQGLYDEVLMPLVAAWEEADPSRPVIPAFEVIFGVAQGTPQADESWLGHGSFEDVQLYLDFAAANDMIVLIDTQVGFRTVEQEVEYMMPLLEHPNAHLAIDPEFAMREGEVIGENIGQIDASEINWAQEQMAALSAELGIPEKIVMIHQFHHTMIENNENIVDVSGVELVIHADGHGAPAEKETTYNVMVTQWIETLPFFAGFKVWLNNDSGFGDEPRLEPVDMVLLNPAPDVVTYQ